MKKGAESTNRRIKEIKLNAPSLCPDLKTSLAIVRIFLSLMLIQFLMVYARFGAVEVE